MDFFPEKFFDLSIFEHEELFDPDEPVWAVLNKIAPYLKRLTLGKIEGHIEPGAYLINPEQISIGKGSVVEAGAYISGPCIIGENCQVRHGAYIRGNVILGKGAVVGHATEAKNVIFLEEAHAGHFSYVGDSVLGSRTNLGAGAVLANLRFDKKNIPIYHAGQKIDTGLRKFGAILGDDAQMGCNAVTNPGTLVEKRGVILPCSTVKGIIYERPARALQSSHR